jgi:hypothetical protein
MEDVTHFMSLHPDALSLILGGEWHVTMVPTT